MDTKKINQTASSTVSFEKGATFKDFTSHKVDVKHENSNQTSITHPLAEVFGFPTTNHSNIAIEHREKQLCPFNNNILNCTKDKKQNPLGVCSMFHNSETVIICPVRFREKWKICLPASQFFFAKGIEWTALKEVRLKDSEGRSAGNIDIVLVAHNKEGKVLDFGSIEIQSVYVSGNIRKPFDKFISDPIKNELMDWSNKSNYPRPDYLSSSRKRLIPQLIYKGLILKSWRKKQIVVIDKSFYKKIPIKASSNKYYADMCWLIYEHLLSEKTNKFEIQLFKKIYENFEESIKRITTPTGGSIEDFVAELEKKLGQEIKLLKKRYGVWAFSQLWKSKEQGKTNYNKQDVSHLSF